MISILQWRILSSKFLQKKGEKRKKFLSLYSEQKGIVRSFANTIRLKTQKTNHLKLLKQPEIINLKTSAKTTHVAFLHGVMLRE
jgi:hypothetical protein